MVIPCYRYGHYLREAVRCAFAQRSVDVRVVIVDDHSPDDSLDVALAIARRDERVRVIAHATNLGHIQTYNDGLAAVDTEFVTLVSADDLVAPGALDRAAALMEWFPRVGMVFGEVVRFETDPPARTGGRVRPTAWRIFEGRSWAGRVAEDGANPITSPEVVVRTAAMDEIGLYNAALPHAGDLEYWLRVASEWDVGQVRGRVQAFYRVHGQNMHITQFASNVVNIRQKMSAFDFLASPQVGTRWPDARLVHDTASDVLSAEAIDYAHRSLAAGDLPLADAFAELARDIARTDGARRAAHDVTAVVRDRANDGA